LIQHQRQCANYCLSTGYNIFFIAAKSKCVHLFILIEKKVNAMDDCISNVGVHPVENFMARYLLFYAPRNKRVASQWQPFKNFEE